jgi:hypothetical protein
MLESLLRLYEHENELSNEKALMNGLNDEKHYELQNELNDDKNETQT